MHWKYLLLACFASSASSSVAYLFGYHAGMKKGVEMTKAVADETIREIMKTAQEGYEQLAAYTKFCIERVQERPIDERDDRGPSIN